MDSFKRRMIMLETFKLTLVRNIGNFYFSLVERDIHILIKNLEGDEVSTANPVLGRLMVNNLRGVRGSWSSEILSWDSLKLMVTEYPFFRDTQCSTTFLWVHYLEYWDDQMSKFVRYEKEDSGYLEALSKVYHLCISTGFKPISPEVEKWTKEFLFNALAYIPSAEDRRKKLSSIDTRVRGELYYNRFYRAFGKYQGSLELYLDILLSLADEFLGDYMSGETTLNCLSRSGHHTIHQYVDEPEIRRAIDESFPCLSSSPWIKMKNTLIFIRDYVKFLL